MSIYPLYKEIFPSTVVDNVICAAFTSPNEVNVIIARTSILQIYRFIEDIELIAEENTGEDESNLTQELGKDDDQVRWYLISLLNGFKCKLSILG